MPRFLTMIKLDEQEFTGPPSDDIIAEMTKLLDEMRQSGVLLDDSGLKSTAESQRVHLSGGKTTTTDGPFTETKEMVGGYLMLQAKDREEAVEWARRFLLVHGDQWNITCEVRELVAG
ncbi:YciI family protein [Streptomyces boninensis]|uniref:YciI family protein n=1 Tax=Streptomyces boninensis TaxID=2039455 RepID=UPI003B210F21